MPKEWPGRVDEAHNNAYRMMPTRIYLIRHAETVWNAEGRLQGTLDAPLSDRGRGQAHRLVEMLRRIPLSAVYSSPLERAHGTARTVAAAHGLVARPVDAFREMNQGEWEGRLVEEVAAEYGESLTVWRDSPAETRLPGGETLAEVARRAVGALHDVAARHAGQTLAVVAHGGVNKTILLTVLGAPLDHHWRIRQGNACINVIEMDGAEARIMVLNDTFHLGPDV
jgi:broad specificity phosphatase PhoE